MKGYQPLTDEQIVDRAKRPLISKHGAGCTCALCAETKLARQLIEIREELKKYLSMADEETIIGGIRNLAQISFSSRDAADQLEKERDSARGLLALAAIELPDIAGPIHHRIRIWQKQYKEWASARDAADRKLVVRLRELGVKPNDPIFKDPEVKRWSIR